MAFVFPFVASSPERGTTPYWPRHEKLTHTFGGNRLRPTPTPGDILETWTEDCLDGRARKTVDLPSLVLPAGNDNPQAGPFASQAGRVSISLAVGPYYTVSSRFQRSLLDGWAVR